MKKIMQGILTGALVFGATICCADTPVNNNATENTLKPQLANFNALTVAGAFIVHVTVGPTQNVIITGDPQLLAKLQTEVKDGVLNIHYPKDVATQMSNTPTIAIAVPELNALTLEGDDKVDVTQLKNTNFTLLARGDQNINLAGKVDTFKIDLAGNIKLDAQALVAQKASLDARGDAKITLNVTTELHTHAMGNVIVKVYGHPKMLTSSMFGNGHVEAVTH